MDQIAVVIALAFWISLLSAGALIALSASRPAQFFFCAILGATALTAISDLSLSQEALGYAYIAIDSALLAIALLFVMKSSSYWPIWFSGFQSITVASEVAKITHSGMQVGMYLDVAGFWSIPALIFMVVGVNLDRVKLGSESHKNAWL